MGNGLFFFWCIMEDLLGFIALIYVIGFIICFGFYVTKEKLKTALYKAVFYPIIFIGEVID